MTHRTKGATPGDPGAPAGLARRAFEDEADLLDFLGEVAVPRGGSVAVIAGRFRPAPPGAGETAPSGEALSAFRLGALARGLAADGAEVTVVTTNPPPHAPPVADPPGVGVSRWPVLRDRGGNVRGVIISDPGGNPTALPFTTGEDNFLREDGTFADPFGGGGALAPAGEIGDVQFKLTATENVASRGAAPAAPTAVVATTASASSVRITDLG